MQILYKVLCGITLLVVFILSYGTLPMFVQAMEPFALIHALSFILLATALLFAIFDRLDSRILRVSVAVVVGLTIISLLIIAFGGLQDMLGVVCPGFFMAERSPCIASTAWIAILVIGAVYVPATIILALALVVGMIDEGQRRKKLTEAKLPKTQP